MQFSRDLEAPANAANNGCGDDDDDDNSDDDAVPFLVPFSVNLQGKRKRDVTFFQGDTSKGNVRTVAVSPAVPKTASAYAPETEDKPILEHLLDDLLHTTHAPCAEEKTFSLFSQLLREHCGIASGEFRHGQQDVILSILKGLSTLAVCPTGWGKSLCYQFPMLVHRLLFEHRWTVWEEGVRERKANPSESPRSKFCIVVSPLIALMSDQSEKLFARGALKSVVLSAAREEAVIQDLSRPNATVDIVFVSPERLVSSMPFRRLLAEQAERIAVICVDEVHCVSKWAYDFRPVFMYVNRVFADGGVAGTSVPPERIAGATPAVATDAPCRGPPFLCLTATASEDVVQDIQRMFRIVNTFNETSRTRHNLQLESVDLEAVQHGRSGSGSGSGSGDSVHAVQERVLEAIVTLPKPLIVYVHKRAQADELCSYLMQKVGSSAAEHLDPGAPVKVGVFGKTNFAAGSVHKAAPRADTRMVVRCYHAGLSGAMRTRTQKQFMDNQIDVLVATVAFGMGIDKNNIRSIVHAYMPSSLDSYLQEVGRAGRDGAPSFCRLLWNPFEFFHLRCRLWSSLLSYEEVSEVVRCFMECPVSQLGEKMMLISPSKISTQLVVNEEMIETLLFLLATTVKGLDDSSTIFKSIEGMTGLAYKVSLVGQGRGNRNPNADENGEEESKKDRKELMRSLRAWTSASTSTTPQAVSVSNVLSQLQAADPLLDYCRQHGVIPNAIQAANQLRLPFPDFEYRLHDLQRCGTLRCTRQNMAYVVKLSPSYAEASSPAGIAYLSTQLVAHLQSRVDSQERALRTMFEVLQTPEHERINAALAEGSEASDCAVHVWQPPATGRLSRADAVSLVDDFITKNRERLTDPFEAFRCLAGVMPKSMIKHGKYAGQIPLSQSWYVHSPYFGALKQFDADWIHKVISAHAFEKKESEVQQQP